MCHIAVTTVGEYVSRPVIIIPDAVIRNRPHFRPVLIMIDIMVPYKRRIRKKGTTKKLISSVCSILLDPETRHL